MRGPVIHENMAVMQLLRRQESVQKLEVCGVWREIVWCAELEVVGVALVFVWRIVYFSSERANLEVVAGM
jgi:hypothetical protein